MHGQQQCNTCSTCMFILIEDLGFKKSSGLMSRLSFFHYFGSKLTGKRLIYYTTHNYCIIIRSILRPKYKIKEFLRVGAGLTFVIRWYSFIISAMFLLLLLFFFFGYSNLLLVHLRLKHRVNVFFFFFFFWLE